MNAFIQQGCITFFKRDSKDIPSIACHTWPSLQLTFKMKFHNNTVYFFFINPW